MTKLTIKTVSKHYAAVRAVEDVSLEVAQGELVALLGPSGCGKTTLLRMIAGFVPASAGRIMIGEADVTNWPPHKRNTGMVFQGYALFPHMTVAENVAFGLQMRKVAAAEIRRRVGEALELVHMERFAARYPRELSGGQQQRVAVARALVVSPDVFLLDEPLSNLDAKLRQSVGQEIRALQQRLGLTTVFVTHDQDEALVLADRLVVMNEGRVVQTGSGRELYHRPRSRFVAGFLGRTNLIEGRYDGEGRFTARSGLALRGAEGGEGLARGVECAVCLRPENIVIGAAADSLPNRFDARVESVTYLGSTSEFTVSAGGESLIVERQNREGEEIDVKPGDAVRIGWREEAGFMLE
ncbi:ABC transporter ATP-binding protein [Acidiphilium sp. JA12-A1]|uniref:ABC transporter ATP-binding protein n=1 Tax=Acidiphilium sp. JA12-A1 TaxID=1464546 RepID=UPI0004618DA0|nr:ABC transporter ATP-binding protein [Acidiphilium sp. JA12-A1]KDM65371.1 spermidine/putrescine import ATP-binding protein PotA [Acidiphilium sp. JA12-A1]